MNMRPNRLLIAPWIALCLLGSSACASSMAGSKLEDPRGLIDLNARMPTGDSPYGIAYGAPTPARVRPDSPNIDAYLKPAVVAARPTRVMIAKAEPVKQPRIQEQAAPVAMLPAEPVVVAPEQDPLLAMAEPVAPVTGDDSSRYADREAKSQNLEQFRGGDAVVITTGTLLVILLVVILILLLT